jgi:hypothetical protein
VKRWPLVLTSVLSFMFLQSSVLAQTSTPNTDAKAAAVPDKLGKLIFEDDFERAESQQEKDEVGNGWGTNSKSRAKGNKQVDLRNGAMYIYIHEVADHAVSVTQPAEFQNGSVKLRFMLEGEQDSLGLDFADSQCKEVHAGHLCAAKISTKEVSLIDHKTGGMSMVIYELKKAGKLTSDMKQQIQSKTQRIPNKIAVGKWHDLLVTINGEALSVAIDGEVVGAFKSEGIGHPTKRMLRLGVPKNAVVDDVKIYAASVE